MSKNQKLRGIIQSFKYENNVVKVQKNKVSKQITASKKKIEAKQQLQELQPSLGNGLAIVFVGYNPGVESSIKQHHYAHFTNLFWKLFNESRVLFKVLDSLNIDVKNTLKEDQLLQKLVEQKDKDLISIAKPEHDFDLVKYKIGFTDLVLRCTKTAQELTMKEKLENVPRLIGEFNSSKTKIIVFVGKGIWEVVVKYLCSELGIKQVKMNKENFQWGKQRIKGSGAYDEVISKFNELIPKGSEVFVFPNTSGLVASMSYSEKLQLWLDLSTHI